MKNIQYSKKISYWLRHNPSDADLILDENGWCGINDILKALNYSINVDDLISLNNSFDKKRWEFNENFEKIRASHGHSVEVNLSNKIKIPPPILYHGTTEKYLKDIIKLGLIPKSRKYVHLSDRLDIAIETGKRHGKPFIIEINTQIMSNTTFLNTSDNIWLTKIIEYNHLNFYPWIFTANDDKDYLNNEIFKERKTNHELYACKINLNAIMRRIDNDDVLLLNSNDNIYYSWSAPLKL